MGCLNHLSEGRRLACKRLTQKCVHHILRLRKSESQSLAGIHCDSEESYCTGVGKSSFTVVCMGKDMQVVTFTIALLTPCFLYAEW